MLPPPDVDEPGFEVVLDEDVLEPDTVVVEELEFELDAALVLEVEPEERDVDELLLLLPELPLDEEVESLLSSSVLTGGSLELSLQLDARSAPAIKPNVQLAQGAVILFI